MKFFFLSSFECLIALVDDTHHEGITKDTEVRLLLDQKEKARKEIEALQIKLLDQENVIQKKQNDLQRIKQRQFQVTCELIMQNAEARYNPKQFSLQHIALQNAQRYFHHALKKAEMKGYDPDLMCYIIEANTLFCRIHSKLLQNSITDQLIWQLGRDVAKATYERDKLAYYLGAGVSKPVLTEAEQFFHQVVGLPMPGSFKMALPLPVECAGIKTTKFQ